MISKSEHDTLALISWLTHLGTYLLTFIGCIDYQTRGWANPVPICIAVCLRLYIYIIFMTKPSHVPYLVISPTVQNQPYLRHPLSECILHSVVAEKKEQVALKKSNQSRLSHPPIDRWSIFHIAPHLWLSLQRDRPSCVDAFGDGVYSVSSISVVAAWNEGILIVYHDRL